MDDPLKDPLRDFVTTSKPAMRVMEHPNVMVGYCVLIHESGDLAFVGPLKDCTGFQRGSTWMISPADFTRLREYYEGAVVVPGKGQVRTLQ